MNKILLILFLATIYCQNTVTNHQSCLKQTEVIIIPHFEDGEGTTFYSYFHLLTLVKYLVRDVCIKTWIYAREYKQFIEVNKENVDDVFINGDIGSGIEIDIPTVLNMLTDAFKNILEPQTSDKYQRSIPTLLYLAGQGRNGGNKFISRKLKSLEDNDHYRIILMCLSPYEKDLCTLSKTWLPRNRLAQIFTYGGSNYLVNILFKTDIHKLLLGLVRNHNWDPFNAFKELETYTCGKEKIIHLYLWTNDAMDKGQYFGHQLLLEIYIQECLQKLMFSMSMIS
uniref:Cnidarian restricted protein n=1 Tax=Clytia hemisphaerica TaxID=252671 RepID=A0A7M5UT77_9CNID